MTTWRRRTGIMSDPSPNNGPPEIDTSVPHVARGYDYLVGGENYFEVDRQAVEEAFAAYPGGVDAARANVRANRRFLVRTVNFLVEAGIRQFLDIGTGIPSVDYVHKAAQRAAPECRIVYVDHDPVVLALSHELLQSTEEGATAFLFKDLRDPDGILAEAAETLDLTEPVAILLISLLHAISDDDGPHEIVDRLLDAMPSGSYLAISHLSSEVTPEAAELIRRSDEMLPEPVVDRNQAQIALFFDGLDLVDPGVVQICQWRPEGEGEVVPGGTLPPWYGGVGRKP